jgi:quinol monooxygenase YgiN
VCLTFDQKTTIIKEVKKQMDNATPHSLSGSSNLLYVVRSIVNSSVERVWDKWHSESHIPDVLKQPGFLKATKLRRSDSPRSDPEYWTIMK